VNRSMMDTAMDSNAIMVRGREIGNVMYRPRQSSGIGSANDPIHQTVRIPRIITAVLMRGFYHIGQGGY